MGHGPRSWTLLLSFFYEDPIFINLGLFGVSRKRNFALGLLDFDAYHDSHLLGRCLCRFVSISPFLRYSDSSPHLPARDPMST